MKKIVALIPIFTALHSCSEITPVKFNDEIVVKIDSVVGYQNGFIDQLGKEGDSMQTAYKNMNAFIDQSIVKVAKMPEATNGEEFKAKILQILNNLKATNLDKGKAMMAIYDKADRGEEITDADYKLMDRLAGEYDDAWAKDLADFDAEQKKFAGSNGIKLQEVGKIRK